MQVYAIQNEANGKLYIGQTIRDLAKYWAYNLRRAALGKTDKPALYSAIRKYGPQAFTVRSIYTAATKRELDNAECCFIKLFGTRQRTLGYNMTDGGDGTVGATRTEEWKRNISKGNMDKKWDDARKQQASISRKGRVLTEEHKQKIRNGGKGTTRPPRTEEWKARQAAAQKGKKKPRTAKHARNCATARLRNAAAKKGEQCQ
jgi:group I intron endonuclease